MSNENELNQAKKSVNNLMNNLINNVSKQQKKHESDEIFEFPCDFPIKVMGKNHPDLHLLIGGIIKRHVDNFDFSAIQIKASTAGKYLSITCSIIATSREQLDNIYQELTSHPAVLMAL